MIKRVLVIFFVALTVFWFDSVPVGDTPINAPREVKNKYAASLCQYSLSEVQKEQIEKQWMDVARKKAEYQTSAANERAQASDKTVVISFAGDCTLGIDELDMPYDQSLPHRLAEQNNDYGYFFRKVKPVFENDDLTLVNLEGTFTTAVKKANKKFRFKGDPSYVNILKQGSIEMVNIANNHIYDYMKDGFEDTTEALRAGGIKYSGEGYIAYHKTAAATIASLGYNGWNTAVKEKAGKDIRKAKEKAQLVIVTFHWGSEYNNYPNKVQQELGRFCIDNGADIVIGHHPHVIQGIENYRGKYIVYSLGNFCFGGNSKPPDMYTFIFQSTFSLQDGKSVRSEGRIIPCRVSSVMDINDYQPVILTGDERTALLKRLYQYSSKLKYGIKPEDEVSKEPA